MCKVLGFGGVLGHRCSERNTRTDAEGMAEENLNAVGSVSELKEAKERSLVCEVYTRVKVKVAVMC